MAEIIQFPKRNRGRVRKSKSPYAEGICAMAQFETYPHNVDHVHRSSFDDVSIIDLFAFGLDTLFRSLPNETKCAIKRSAMIEAGLAKDPRKRIVAALFSGAFEKGPE